MKKLFVFLTILLILPLAYAKTEQTPNKASSQLSDQEMYSAGRGALEQENYELAIKLYKALEREYPHSQYAKQARIDEAYAYQHNDKPQEALSIIESFLKLYPTYPHIDYVYYLQALVHYENHTPLFLSWNRPKRQYQQTQSIQKAVDLLKAFIQRYPKSEYTKSAQQKLQEATAILGQHDLSIAQFYLKRGAYLAAVTRAQEVLEKYPNTSACEAALAVLIKGYEGLKNPVFSNNARQALQKKYPTSKYLKE